MCIHCHIYILEDWDRYVNVEYCGSHYTPIYLYKYVLKGAKKERFRLTNADDIADDDEISLHIDSCTSHLQYGLYVESNGILNISRNS